jgi:hypothetical protein
LDAWLKEQISGLIEQIPGRGQTYLSDIGPTVGEMCLLQSAPTRRGGPGQKWWLGPPPFPVSAMSPDDSLLLILRRLDEIERKLNQVLQELRTPTAIGYSVRKGNRPRED